MRDRTSSTAAQPLAQQRMEKQAAEKQPSSSPIDLPPSLRVISLNCWGLKFISKLRTERLAEIGRQLALASPTPNIVGLQECWTQQDYEAIRAATKHILPYGKFYFSGIFGGGLAILSKWPIEESRMHRYTLNGRPAAFYRGDWYVGKGVACARIRVGQGDGDGNGDVIEVFCTHLHAPYEREPNDSYLCHRTAQAWEMAWLVRHAAERGHAVLALGDFNMVPLSLAHRIVEAHSPARDVWRLLRPDSMLGSASGQAEKIRGRTVAPPASDCIETHGTTCDSLFNTWRWSKSAQKDLLQRGKDSEVDGTRPDEDAKRLDYIFFAGASEAAKRKGYEWKVESAQVGMTMRHPTLRCSLSDHFSVETTIVAQPTTSPSPPPAQPPTPPKPTTYLPVETYDEILAMIATYGRRERKQRALRLTHFVLEIPIAIGCFVGIWWARYNYVAFVLILVSTFGLSLGVLDGLMGGLFVGSELRALREFEWEIERARERAVELLERSGGNDGG